MCLRVETPNEYAHWEVLIMGTPIRSKLNGTNPEEMERLLRLWGPRYVCDKESGIIPGGCTPETLERWFREQPGYEGFSIWRYTPTFKSPPGELTAKDIMGELKAILEDLYRSNFEKDNQIMELRGIIELMRKEANRKNSLSSKEVLSYIEPFINPAEGLLNRFRVGP